MIERWQVPLWEAINERVILCGGDPNGPGLTNEMMASAARIGEVLIEAQANAVLDALVEAKENGYQQDHIDDLIQKARHAVLARDRREGKAMPWERTRQAIESLAPRIHSALSARDEQDPNQIQIMVENIINATEPEMDDVQVVCWGTVERTILIHFRPMPYASWNEWFKIDLDAPIERCYLRVNPPEVLERTEVTPGRIYVYNLAIPPSEVVNDLEKTASNIVIKTSKDAINGSKESSRAKSQES